MAAATSEYWIVEKDEMENFMERCMLSVDTKPSHAKALAECLIHGDHRGHFSHGLNRLGKLKKIFFFPFCGIYLFMFQTFTLETSSWAIWARVWSQLLFKTHPLRPLSTEITCSDRLWATFACSWPSRKLRRSALVWL